MKDSNGKNQRLRLKGIVNSFQKNLFALEQDLYIFAIAKSKMVLTAKIAQLVEHDLAKVGVAGSSPVFRSFIIRMKKVEGREVYPDGYREVPFFAHIIFKIR